MGRFVDNRVSASVRAKAKKAYRSESRDRFLDPSDEWARNRRIEGDGRFQARMVKGRRESGVVSWLGDDGVVKPIVSRKKRFRVYESVRGGGTGRSDGRGLRRKGRDY